MGFATHLGPWLLGTVKDTTGTTAGTMRNTGACITVQQTPVAYTDAATAKAFVLPAGASISIVNLFITTAFTSGTTATITLFVNGTSIGATTISGLSTGRNALTIGTSNPTLLTNVGAPDAVITYTIATATAGAGVLECHYIVRNSDGALYPASA